MLAVIMLATANARASSFLIKAANNNLEIGETLGSVYPTVSVSEAPELKGGTITGDGGETAFKQYIILGDVNNPLQSAKISFTIDNADKLGDFLYIAGGGASAANAIFEYQLSFTEGIANKEVDGELPGLHNQKVNILSDEYTIVRTVVNGNSLIIDLAKGAAETLIKEGEASTFKIGDKEYKIEVMNIASGPPRKVKLKVNGKDIQELQKAETIGIDEGITLGVNDLLITQGGDTKSIVKLFVAANLITFEDTNYADNTFIQGFSINKKKVPTGFTSIKASKTGDQVKITAIKYRLVPTKNIFIKPKSKLSDYVDDKLGMLGNWDMRYEGLDNTVPQNIIAVTPSNNQEYNLRFTNQDGQSFVVPFVSKQGTFKLGNANQALVFVESAGDTTFNINLNDYFMLTNSNDKQGKTYVLKYSTIDTTNHVLQFENLAGGTLQVPYTVVTTTGLAGVATLRVGSINANVSIASNSGNQLAIDNNGNGLFASNAIDIVTKDGGIIDVGTTNSISAPYSFTLSTVQSQFESASSNESMTFQITSSSNIGISSTVTGLTLVSSGTELQGMSTYGTFVKISNVNTANPPTVTINYPARQIFGQVYLDFGAASGQTQVSAQEVKVSTCGNRIQDGDETGIDCGGSCLACPTCTDGIKNQGEEGIDCGSPCQKSCQIGNPPKTNENECSGGCLFINEKNEKSCVLSGKVVQNLYCDSDSTLKSLKSNGLPCGNGYECKIGICENGACGKHITIFALIINLIILGILVAILLIAVSLLRSK